MHCGSFDGHLWCGSYDPASSSLVLSTEKALYRLSTAQLESASVQEPVLFAGQEEFSGPKDGVGT